MYFMVFKLNIMIVQEEGKFWTPWPTQPGSQDKIILLAPEWNPQLWLAEPVLNRSRYFWNFGRCCGGRGPCPHINQSSLQIWSFSVEPATPNNMRRILLFSLLSASVLGINLLFYHVGIVDCLVFILLLKVFQATSIRWNTSTTTTIRAMPWMRWTTMSTRARMSPMTTVLSPSPSTTPSDDQKATSKGEFIIILAVIDWKYLSGSVATSFGAPTLKQITLRKDRGGQKATETEISDSGRELSSTPIIPRMLSLSIRMP